MRKTGLIVLILAVFVLTGCVWLRYPEPGEPLGKLGDRALVYGKITIKEGGKEFKPWSSNLLDVLATFGRPNVDFSIFWVEAGARGFSVAVEGDGHFYWIIPRGTYLLYHTCLDPLPSNEAFAAFQVPARGDAVYAGTLIVHVESEYESSSDEIGFRVTAVEVEDAYEEELKILRKRHPGLALDVTKILARYDPVFPGLFKDYDRYQCERILNRNGLTLLSYGTR
ncbi:MAG TPA: hypothetical protein PLR20_09585 [Syntrophales bacterium]|nr:hypothetical protein [Syntrophales bacterium]HOX94084.1 hypothetical protein [Syntrophales bacterium]HPI58016.1 hypothetical protein [Syntrophales bacterium]HPN25856.1 hypothetical protein [Syntrophales bacterium]HQM29588.1 hypothetical protein [Syntrophales bacterium]